LKKAELVLVGRIVRSQGRDGHLKVRFTEKPPRIRSGSRLYLRRGREFEGFEVESLTLDRNSHFLKLRGIDTLARADAVAGGELFAEAGGFPPLERGRYYEFQIIGSRVVRKDGAEVGTVARILPAGGSELLVVERDGREAFVPFTETICVEIDPEAGVIVIDPPDGLLDLNEI